jgi:hypothetical protein
MMRKQLRRLLTAAVGAIVATTALIAPASSASAAYPTCNSWTTLRPSSGYVFHIPSLGRNSGNYLCQLQLYDGYNGGGAQSAVFVLQGSLNSCHQAGLTQDGKYGPLTRNAVTWIYRSVGLPDPPEGVGVYTQVAMVFAIKWLGQREVGGETRRTCLHYGAI